MNKRNSIHFIDLSSNTSILTLTAHYSLLLNIFLSLTFVYLQVHDEQYCVNIQCFVLLSGDRFIINI